MEALFGKPYKFQKLLYLYLLSHSKSFPTRLAPKTGGELSAHLEVCTLMCPPT